MTIHSVGEEAGVLQEENTKEHRQHDHAENGIRSDASESNETGSVPAITNSIIPSVTDETTSSTAAEIINPFP